MGEMYISKPDGRVSIANIYDDFRDWIIARYGNIIWNNITKRQVYDALKTLPNYKYVRYSDGYYLRGIAYRFDVLQPQTFPNINHTIPNVDHPVPIVTQTTGTNDGQGLTLNISLDIRNRQTAPPQMPQFILPAIGRRREMLL